jgi:hypothetical protein
MAFHPASSPAMPPMPSSRLQRTLSALALAAIAIAAPAQSGATALFRDLTYGTPIDQFGPKKGYYDCTADLGYTARCVDNVNFLGHTFELQILAFTNGQLRTVELVTEFKQEIYVTLLKALAENFSLLALQSAEGRLDLVDTARKEGGARIGAKVAEFESIALEKGQLTYIFLEQAGPKLALFRNTFEAVMGSPATAREADVVLKEKDNQAHIGVTFSLPLRARQDLRNAPVPKEKF